MKKIITIDFRNCKSIDDAKDLIKSNLGISNLDNPDLLLKLLKELKKCQIRIKGANLVPAAVNKYIEQITDILYKIEDSYNNIDVRVIDVVTIDFTGVKTWRQIEDIISEALDFPEWYGRNLDALWDLLIREIAPHEICLTGTNSIPKNLFEYMETQPAETDDIDSNWNDAVIEPMVDNEEEN